MPHGRTEVQWAPAQVTTLPGEAGGQLAGEGLDGLAHRLDLVARGVHELDVLRQRLAHAQRECLGSSVSDQPAADLGLDLLLQLFDAGPVLILEQSLLQRGQPTCPSTSQHQSARGLALCRGVVRAGPVACQRARLVHQPGEHAVEVEVPKSPVEVVRATDRAPHLDRRITRHREACDGAEQQLVTVPQRSEQHRRDLLGRDRLQGSGARRCSAFAWRG